MGQVETIPYKLSPMYHPCNLEEKAHPNPDEWEWEYKVTISAPVVLFLIREGGVRQRLSLA